MFCYHKNFDIFTALSLDGVLRKDAGGVPLVESFLILFLAGFGDSTPVPKMILFHDQVDSISSLALVREKIDECSSSHNLPELEQWADGANFFDVGGNRL